MGNKSLILTTELELKSRNAKEKELDLGSLALTLDSPIVQTPIKTRCTNIYSALLSPGTRLVQGFKPKVSTSL